MNSKANMKQLLQRFSFVLLALVFGFSSASWADAIYVSQDGEEDVDNHISASELAERIIGQSENDEAYILLENIAINEGEDSYDLSGFTFSSVNLADVLEDRPQYIVEFDGDVVVDGNDDDELTLGEFTDLVEPEDDGEITVSGVTYTWDEDDFDGGNQARGGVLVEIPGEWNLDLPNEGVVETVRVSSGVLFTGGSNQDIVMDANSEAHVGHFQVLEGTVRVFTGSAAADAGALYVDTGLLVEDGAQLDLVQNTLVHNPEVDFTVTYETNNNEAAAANNESPVAGERQTIERSAQFIVDGTITSIDVGGAEVVFAATQGDVSMVDKDTGVEVTDAEEDYRDLYYEIEGDGLIDRRVYQVAFLDAFQPAKVAQGFSLQSLHGGEIVKGGIKYSVDFGLEGNNDNVFKSGIAVFANENIYGNVKLEAVEEADKVLERGNWKDGVFQSEEDWGASAAILTEGNISIERDFTANSIGDDAEDKVLTLFGAANDDNEVTIGQDFDSNSLSWSMLDDVVVTVGRDLSVTDHYTFTTGNQGQSEDATLIVQGDASIDNAIDSGFSFNSDIYVTGEADARDGDAQVPQQFVSGGNVNVANNLYAWDEFEAVNIDVGGYLYSEGPFTAVEDLTVEGDVTSYDTVDAENFTLGGDLIKDGADQVTVDETFTLNGEGQEILFDGGPIYTKYFYVTGPDADTPAGTQEIRADGVDEYIFVEDKMVLSGLTGRYNNREEGATRFNFDNDVEAHDNFDGDQEAEIILSNDHRFVGQGFEDVDDAKISPYQVTYTGDRGTATGMELSDQPSHVVVNMDEAQRDVSFNEPSEVVESFQLIRGNFNINEFDLTFEGDDGHFKFVRGDGQFTDILDPANITYGDDVKSIDITYVNTMPLTVGGEDQDFLEWPDNEPDNDEEWEYAINVTTMPRVTDPNDDDTISEIAPITLNNTKYIDNLYHFDGDLELDGYDLIVRGEEFVLNTEGGGEYVEVGNSVFPYYDEEEEENGTFEGYNAEFIADDDETFYFVSESKAELRAWFDDATREEIDLPNLVVNKELTEDDDNDSENVTDSYHGASEYAFDLIYGLNTDNNGDVSEVTLNTGYVSVLNANREEDVWAVVFDGSIVSTTAYHNEDQEYVHAHLNVHGDFTHESNSHVVFGNINGDITIDGDVNKETGGNGTLATIEYPVSEVTEAHPSYPMNFEVTGNVTQDQSDEGSRSGSIGIMTTESFTVGGDYHQVGGDSEIGHGETVVEISGNFSQEWAEGLVNEDDYRFGKPDFTVNTTESFTVGGDYDQIAGNSYIGDGDSELYIGGNFSQEWAEVDEEDIEEGIPYFHSDGTGDATFAGNVTNTDGEIFIDTEYFSDDDYYAVVSVEGDEGFHQHGEAGVALTYIPAATEVNFSNTTVGTGTFIPNYAGNPVESTGPPSIVQEINDLPKFTTAELTVGTDDTEDALASFFAYNSDSEEASDAKDLNIEVTENFMVHEDEGEGEQTQFQLGFADLNISGDYHFAGVGDEFEADATDTHGLRGRVIFAADEEASEVYTTGNHYAAQFHNVRMQGNAGLVAQSDLTLNTLGSLVLGNGVLSTGDYTLHILNITPTVGDGLEGRNNSVEEGPSNDPRLESATRSAVQLGTRDSYVDGTMRRAFGQIATATGGVVADGYLWPMGTVDDEGELRYSGLILQSPSTLGQARFATVSVDDQKPEAASDFSPFTTDHVGDEELNLNVVAPVYFSVNFDEQPGEDPNIRFLSQVLQSRVSGDEGIKRLRIVQNKEGEEDWNLAGTFDTTGDPVDDFDGIPNSFINGVPNVTQEGMELASGEDQTSYIAVASDQAINPLDGEIDGMFATQLSGIHQAHDEGPVYTDASGHVNAMLDGDDLTISGSFSNLSSELEDIGDFGPAHIHAATAGNEGGIVTALEVDADDDGMGGTFHADDNTFDVSELDEDVVSKMEAGELYVNIHTANYPGGELRGQMLETPNEAPTATEIESPASDVRVDLEGDDTQNFTATWTESEDPDEDRVVYIWELATDSDFENVVFAANTGTSRAVDLDYADVDATLEAAGVEVGEDVRVHHRALSTDGSNITDGSRSSVLVRRGEVTDSPEDPEVPEELALDQNYPNPFNPTTNISYQLPERTDVQLTVYNSLGQEVATLVDETVDAGQHEVSFDGSDLSSGVYIYRLQADGEVITKQMTFVK